MFFCAINKSPFSLNFFNSCNYVNLNGNFFVRPSQHSDAKCTISLWYNGVATNIRIKQLANKRYQLAYKCDTETDAEEELEEEVPPCGRYVAPVIVVTDHCTILCTRDEADYLLKKTVNVQEGNFILRPSGHARHPYSLSVYTSALIYHFQIGQSTNNRFMIGPLDRVNLNETPTFCKISDLLRYYLSNPITFRNEIGQSNRIQLKLYKGIGGGDDVTWL
ncbi:unnamed protein product [Didymodactylos carnosus]|uniref:SH2 domain-containing protein n=1 Tax=Didymodactylos carnosus TaxID=1234261 RepID=A0A813RYR4_9BILA|nr:unnamed protein product [Didymodactylos carnosus]CAF0923051.1 unnamed protein product [Didymodactylos carnosus]CAF3575775.1 unnamed protein product [Didymodactylos carnosus]CAF3700300.1 unnamed protein product [Didymodactylos carnosus]